MLKRFRLVIVLVILFIIELAIVPSFPIGASPPLLVVYEGYFSTRKRL